MTGNGFEDKIGFIKLNLTEKCDRETTEKLCGQKEEYLEN